MTFFVILQLMLFSENQTVMIMKWIHSILTLNSTVSASEFYNRF